MSISRNRRSLGALALLSVLALAGCSDEPSASDIQETLAATEESADMPEGMTVVVDQVKCGGGADKASHLCQFRVTPKGKDLPEDLEPAWMIAAFGRKDDTWRMDTTTAQISNQQRSLRINSERIGGTQDEVIRMRDVLGNRGRCESASSDGAWCSSPDGSFATQLFKSSDDGTMINMGNYIADRDQGGTGLQIVEDMILSYGFTAEEFAPCRQGAAIRVSNLSRDGVLPTLSCNGTGKRLVITVSGKPYNGG